VPGGTYIQPLTLRAAIMFVDIRKSTALVEKRHPYDVVFLLNHFFDAVAGAVVDTGGAPNQFVGDGMMAIFGIHAGPREACSQALAAAHLLIAVLPI
jgi:adenylate cyclase